MSQLAKILIVFTTLNLICSSNSYKILRITTFYYTKKYLRLSNLKISVKKDFLIFYNDS